MYIHFTFCSSTGRTKQEVVTLTLKFVIFFRSTTSSIFPTEENRKQEWLDVDPEVVICLCHGVYVSCNYICFSQWSFLFPASVHTPFLFFSSQKERRTLVWMAFWKYKLCCLFPLGTKLVGADKINYTEENNACHSATSVCKVLSCISALNCCGSKAYMHYTYWIDLSKVKWAAKCWLEEVSK